MEKNENKSGGFLTGLFLALGGIAAGVAGKVIYDELSKDEKLKQEEESYKQKALSDNRNKNKKLKQAEPETNDEIEYESFFCPITQEIMKEPVITITKGISYEKSAILNWLKKNPTCPKTRTPLSPDQLIPNYALKSTIEDYLKKQNNK